MANISRIRAGLKDAAYALDEQAAGRVPELSRLLSGAITLDTLFRQRLLDPDLQEAALCLEHLVGDRSRKLETPSRARAAALADKVHLLAEVYADKAAKA